MRRLFTILLLAFFACDSSVRVGELRPDAGAAPPVDVFAPSEGAPDAGIAGMGWNLRAPMIPCSIYALAEVSADKLYVGCTGGRIYRFDGVHAVVTLEVDDTSVVSLLWANRNGAVWAGAQSSYADDATTQLYRLDGSKWSKVGGTSKRIVSLAGAESDVWIATDTQILHYDGSTFVPSFTTTHGAFRACTFSAPDNGYCVGTEGLAVAWDGKAWSSSLTSVPWSSDAELFGVEIETFTGRTAFLYGEPIEHPNGDHMCRAAYLIAGTFSGGQASKPCFTDYGMARRRTGQTSVGLRSFFLLSPTDTSKSTLVFDPIADTVDSLCGSTLAFTKDLASTRAGGSSGLLATIVGVGGKQLALDTPTGPSLDFHELSVASDGTAWARVRDLIACGSVTDRLVRFEKGEWSPVPAPQGALSGNGLAAASRDRAYTLQNVPARLLFHDAMGWTDGPLLDGHPWNVFAARTDDVWIGGTDADFGHYDGKTFTSIKPVGGRRQVEQVVAVDDVVWMIHWGTTQEDVEQHVVRWAGGELTEWNFGVMYLGDRLRLSPLDATHVYSSGHPAKFWDGASWKSLKFNASGVWARSSDEVYFTDNGDIWRWDGKRRERVYHGFIPISAIGGSKDRGFAVGPGGLTIEFTELPSAQR